MSSYAAYIEQIMQEIKEDIETEKLTDDLPDFPDAGADFPIEITQSACPDNALLRRSVMYTQHLKNGQVYFFRELTSYHKSVSKIVIFVKRVIRKLVRFLLEPMVEEINRNREFTALSLEQMQQYLSMHGTQNIETQRMFDELSQLRQQNELLRNKVELLSQQFQNRPQAKEDPQE